MSPRIKLELKQFLVFVPTIVIVFFACIFGYVLTQYPEHPADGIAIIILALALLFTSYRKYRKIDQEIQAVIESEMDNLYKRKEHEIVIPYRTGYHDVRLLERDGTIGIIDTNEKFVLISKVGNKLKVVTPYHPDVIHLYQNMITREIETVDKIFKRTNVI